MASSAFEVPSDWSWSVLGGVATFVNGDRSANYPKQSDFVSSGVAFVNTGHIESTGKLSRDRMDYISRECFERLRSGKIKKGDIVYCLRGSTIGKTARVDLSEGSVASSLVIIRAKPDVSQDFLYYFLVGPLGQSFVRQHDNGSAQPNLSVSAISRYPIPLPPLAEQKAIAAVLGALDDKIELNRRMNATLEAMARALFQSWFVDFDPIRAKLDARPPAGLDAAIAALFPEHLEESNIGKKPVGWEVTTLETTLSVLETGGRPKGGVGGITSGVPSIGAESIVGIGQFDFGKTKFVPVEFFEGMRKGHIESHDVLLYKDGGRPGEYEPHVSMFGDGFPFEKCSINEHVYRLRANERLSQEYLYFWLTSELALAEMRIKGTGVAIPGLNSTAVRTVAVLVPPRRVVEAFTQQAAPLVTRILANAKQSRTLATLRDTLLPKLLSGELSVAGAAKVASA